MSKKTEEETAFRRYKKFIENLYEESRLYRDLVLLSRVVKMIIYVAVGVSIIAVVFFGKPMASLESLVYWMSRTIIGRIVALLFGLSLIIYGLEKLRK